MGRPLREEVLNARLAEILSGQKIVSVTDNHRLPDVVVTDSSGVKFLLEGKVVSARNAVESLEKSCRERIKEGVESFAVAVLYPSGIGDASQDPDSILSSVRLRAKIFTPTSESDWFDTNVDGLAEALQRYRIFPKEFEQVRLREEFARAFLRAVHYSDFEISMLGDLSQVNSEQVNSLLNAKLEEMKVIENIRENPHRKKN